jgi:hypothetical protein
MMVPLLILLLAAQDAPAGPWTGFKEGSSVLTEQKARDHEKPDYYLNTVVDRILPEGTPQLRTSMQRANNKGSVTEDTESARVLKPLTLNLKETARRREKVTIGAKELDCTVIDYRNETLPEGHQQTMTLWKADGVSLPSRDVNYFNGFAALPADLVKMVSERRHGEHVETFKINVLDLSTTLAVGVQKVDCSIEDVRYTLSRPDFDTLRRGRRRWLCEAIPGHVARREEECRAGTGGGEWTVQVLTFKAVR